MQDATHMGTARITRNQVFMKRGKRGQWLKWTNSKHGGRWEGINYLLDDVNPVKIGRVINEETN